MSFVVKPDVVADAYASPLGFSSVAPLPPAGRIIRPGDWLKPMADNARDRIKNTGFILVNNAANDDLVHNKMDN